MLYTDTLLVDKAVSIAKFKMNSSPPLEKYKV